MRQCKNENTGKNETFNYTLWFQTLKHETHSSIKHGAGTENETTWSKFEFFQFYKQGFLILKRFRPVTGTFPNLFLRKQTSEGPQATKLPESWHQWDLQSQPAPPRRQSVLNTRGLKFIGEKISMLEISFTLEYTIALSKTLSIACNCWKASCFTPMIPVLVGNSEDMRKDWIHY